VCTHRSLDVDEIGVVDLGDFENLGPEAGKLMAVIDLDDVELLDDARVQLQLVVLEGGSHLATKIDTQDVVQLLLVL